jgi:hypothetical protein
MSKRFLKKIGIVSLIICTSIVCTTTSSLVAVGHDLDPGDYNISCLTRNGGLKYLDNCRRSDVVRPSPGLIVQDPHARDQVWHVRRARDGYTFTNSIRKADFEGVLFHSLKFIGGGGSYLNEPEPTRVVEDCCMEAFPGDCVVRPRPLNYSQDQIWFISKYQGSGYKIYCNTQNQGTKYLEAFPGANLVRLKDNNHDQDQIWYFEPCDVKEYDRIT